MERENPVVEDMFEKAREAFFGITADITEAERFLRRVPQTAN